MEKLLHKSEVTTLTSIREMFYRLTGVYIPDQKLPMIENRLYRRIISNGLTSLDEYFKLIYQNPDERNQFVSTLTTHLTHFFREERHFELLQQSILSRPQKMITVMCGACSTGEEAYALAATLEKLKERVHFDYRILAFDICQNSVAKGDKGIYTNGWDEIKRHQSSRFFEELDEGRFQARSILRDKIKFRVMNLMELDIHRELSFDYIFLRNVLIYFNKTSMDQVITKLSEFQAPQGKLFLGMSEYIEHSDYKGIGESVYEKCDRSLC